MRGTMIIIDPAQEQPRAIPFDREPTLEQLKAGIGGGYLELVPGFTTIPWGGIVMDCRAFCDEDGKRKDLPHNQVATDLWQQALQRQGRSLGRPPMDVLVGPIAVVFGDREFMAAL
jgi:hypothetical protein